MKTLILSAILSVLIVTTPVADKPAEQWESLGSCRITCYCPVCNDGTGYESSSGKTLKYGYAACNWLPIGTVISIEGELFTIVDTCGTEAIDIFIDTPDGCYCNLNEYKKVSRKVRK